MFTEKSVHKNVYSSSMHNHQNWKCQIFFHRWWITKQWYTHTVAYYSAKIRNYWYTQQRHYVEWKQLDPTSYMVYESIYMTFSKRKTNYSCQGLGVGNIVTLTGVLGVMGQFCSLIVVIVTLNYTCININRTVHKKNPIKQ